MKKPDFSLPLVAEIQIQYKPVFKISERPKIISSQSAFEIFLNSWNQDLISLQEEFKIMFLNNNNRVLGIYNVSRGGITGTLVDVRILFGTILKSAATAIILAHNHPSTTLNPSEADKSLTVKIRNAAQFFDIKVLDHLIITPEAYLSFADEGLLY